MSRKNEVLALEEYITLRKYEQWMDKEIKRVLEETETLKLALKQKKVAVKPKPSLTDFMTQIQPSCDFGTYEDDIRL